MFPILSLSSFIKSAEPPLVRSSAAVRCSALTKDFGRGETRTRVLREIDWEVAPGRMSLLVGPSGCGKTTLISIIAGLLTPTSGSVEVFGRNLARLTPRALVEFRARHIGLSFNSTT